jgi:hypothetical protein
VTHFVEVRQGRPNSLWRRAGGRWQYWSLLGWKWCDVDPPQVTGPPPAARLALVDVTEARRLTADRQRWARYWAAYRRRELGGPDQPVTVVRRRNSPEAARDEVFGTGGQWWWTDLLVRGEVGRGSSVPALQRIDVAEAEEILRCARGVAGATASWLPGGHDPKAPGWHGTGRDTGRHLPAAYGARADAEYRRARRARPGIDRAIGDALRGMAGPATVDTMKPWPSYRRNVAAAWEAGEPIEEAVVQADLHRHAVTVPPRRYAAGVRAAFQGLERGGFAPVSGTHHEFWDNPTYRGVNTVWRHAPTGRLVEILFHTPASFAAMRAGDAPYEVLRCPYLPCGRIAVTPSHRVAARYLLAAAFD